MERNALVFIFSHLFSLSLFPFSSFFLKKGLPVQVVDTDLGDYLFRFTPGSSPLLLFLSLSLSLCVCVCVCLFRISHTHIDTLGPHLLHISRCLAPGKLSLRSFPLEVIRGEVSPRHCRAYSGGCSSFPSCLLRSVSFISHPTRCSSSLPQTLVPSVGVCHLPHLLLSRFSSVTAVSTDCVPALRDRSPA